jgi:hypothetical protein
VGYPRTVVDAAGRSHTVDAVCYLNYRPENVIGHAEANRVQDRRIRPNADVPCVERIHARDVNLVGYRAPNRLGWLARRGYEQRACPVDKGNR